MLLRNRFSDSPFRVGFEQKTTGSVSPRRRVEASQTAAIYFFSALNTCNFLTLHISLVTAGGSSSNPREREP
jgi:hypothetical protein